MNKQLCEAYVLFTAWCSENGKTTAIQRWDTKKLDMSSSLVCIGCKGRVSYQKLIHVLRNDDWPESLGTSKAFDTSLVLAWLESFLAGIEARQQPGIEPHCDF